MDNKRSTYPISKHEQNCVGPCYEQGTFILHPITLNHLTYKDKPFCPTKGWTYTDPKTNVKTSLTVDECIDPTENKDIGKEELKMNILLPSIVFNYSQFLMIYYDIHSFDDSLKWIHDNSSTLTTKMRIIECAWKVWGNKTDFVITDELINFYQIIIQKKWIRQIYHYIKKYIKVIDNKIQLDYPEKYAEDKKFRKEKINYIIKKLLTNNTIYNILFKFIEINHHEWDNIDSYNDSILHFLNDYLEHKILKTIKK